MRTACHPHRSRRCREDADWRWTLTVKIANEFVDAIHYVDLAPITDPESSRSRSPGLRGCRTSRGDRRSTLIDRSATEGADRAGQLRASAGGLCWSIQRCLAAVPTCGCWRPAASRSGRGRGDVAAFRRCHWRMRRSCCSAIARGSRGRDSCYRENTAPVTESVGDSTDPTGDRIRCGPHSGAISAEILDSLHDRFRLLTGGSRTAVRRQQTLRASVDWSHALLTEPELVLLPPSRRLRGRFDLNAAHGLWKRRCRALPGARPTEPACGQVACSGGNAPAGRDTGCSRQCASTRRRNSASPTKPYHSGRPRDYYTCWRRTWIVPPAGRHEKLLEHAEGEIDNFRAAFTWSREYRDTEAAMQLASALLPLWLARGRVVEGLSWFETLLADQGVGDTNVAPAVHARALADKALLDSWGIMSDRLDQAEQALEDRARSGRSGADCSRVDCVRQYRGI